MRSPITDLSEFPITRKWPALHPERIQLYFLADPQWHQGLGDARGDGLALRAPSGGFRGQ